MNDDRLSADVLEALAAADRRPGWNLRPPSVRRFELTGRYGQPCTLTVVSAAMWSYRPRDRAAAARRAARA